jgi:hypothetical protein
VWIILLLLVAVVLVKNLAVVVGLVDLEQALI